MKPKPCVGCGFCCLKSMCFTGAARLGRMEKRCPYLFWSSIDHRYYCWAAMSDDYFAQMVYIGEGCCSSLNSWRKDVKRR